MAIFTKPISFLLFTTLIFSLIPANISDSLSELESLRSESKTGVLHLNDNHLRRILAAKPPRPFYLLIFFDATQLHDKPELNLLTLKSEFSLLASSFITNNQDSPSLSKIFFCEVEFRESQSTFALFGVNALPHIRLVGPSDRDPKTESLQMDAGDFSRLAESMAEYVESKTKLVVGPIHRPPPLSKTQLMIIIAVFLICLPFMVKKLINGDTLLHDWKIWLTGAVFVYFFSVSGAMFNIIRKMPMFITDRNDPNKLVFFYQGSGMQLGAEGFAIGFLYTIVGLLLAFSTHLLVRVGNVTAQRLVMMVALLVSIWAVRQVLFLDNWKTGYQIHAYWPSSWN